MAKTKENIFSTYLGKTNKELMMLLNDEMSSLFDMRMKHKTGQMNETHNLKLARKKIAQIKTAMNVNKERENQS
jgi:large subunit ribosomal protein L29